MAERGRLTEPSLARLRDLWRPPSRSAALASLLVALLTAAWQSPGTFRNLRDTVRGLEATSAADRELRALRGVDADTRVFVRARELIPADARYAVITGPNVRVSNPVTIHAIAPFAGYWLLPRRQVRDPSIADWLLSYGGDLDALGLEYELLVEAAPGVELAQVRH